MDIENLSKKELNLDISNTIIDLSDSLINIKTSEWYKETEDLMKCWGEKAGNLASIHNYEKKRWRQTGNRMAVVSIIITTLNSSLSLSTTTSEYKEQIMYIIGFSGLISTLLQSIKQYYNADERASEHKLYARELSNLYRSIKLQLSIRREERTVANEYIKWVYKTYDKLTNEAPTIQDSSLKKYKELFKTYKSAIPDLCENDLVIIINNNNNKIIKENLDRINNI